MYYVCLQLRHQREAVSSLLVSILIGMIDFEVFHAKIYANVSISFKLPKFLTANFSLSAQDKPALILFIFHNSFFDIQS